MLTIVTDRDTYVLRAPTPTAERLRIAQGLAATGRALIQAANMQERPLASPPATALPVESHNDASDPLLEVRRMEKLGDLFASGLVTETEFRSKRQAILDPEESLQPVQRMQRIAELLEQGLITDEEFQQKRRAILSDL